MRAAPTILTAAATLALAACGGGRAEPVSTAEASPEVAAAVAAIVRAEPFALPPPVPAARAARASARSADQPDDAEASD